MWKCMQQSGRRLGFTIWAWDVGRFTVLQPTLMSGLTWSPQVTAVIAVAC